MRVIEAEHRVRPLAERSVSTILFEFNTQGEGTPLFRWRGRTPRMSLNM